MVIRNVFISSKYRLKPSEKPNNFSVYIPPDFIVCNDTKKIKVNIINFHIPNTMYNVNDNNNKFGIKISSPYDIEAIFTFNLTIPYGNYNVSELRDVILNTDIDFYYKDKISDCIDIIYNKNTNKYTFNNIINEFFKVYIKTNGCGNFLGLEDNVYHLIYPTLESTKPINMVAYPQTAYDLARIKRRAQKTRKSENTRYSKWTGRTRVDGWRLCYSFINLMNVFLSSSALVLFGTNFVCQDLKQSMCKYTPHCLQKCTTCFSHCFTGQVW